MAGGLKGHWGRLRGAPTHSGELGGLPLFPLLLRLLPFPRFMVLIPLCHWGSEGVGGVGGAGQARRSGS